MTPLKWRNRQRSKLVLAGRRQWSPAGQLPPSTALNEPSLKLPFVLCKSLRVALLNR
jgi:hypothetical protein